MGKISESSGLFSRYTQFRIPSKGNWNSCPVPGNLEKAGLRNKPMHLSQFLSSQPVVFETIVHPPAYSSQRLAKCLHISGKQVVKAVLLSGPPGFFLAVLPATQHIDTDLLANELGGPVRLATEVEMAGLFRDCEWGVVPPFGVLYQVPTILEDRLVPDSMLVFEGNTHFEAIRMRCRDFERLEKPRRLKFAVDDTNHTSSRLE
jgi:Ala-tRNA(Pro) deacylase